MLEIHIEYDPIAYQAVSLTRKDLRLLDAVGRKMATRIGLHAVARKLR